MPDNIKEYLIGLGFNVDDAGLSKFSLAIGKSTTEFGALGAVAAKTTIAIEESVVRVARQFEGLYYASLRTGETVAGLQSIGFAARQIGLTTEQAQGAIERFALAMRTNPGLQGLARQLGVGPGTPLHQIQQLVENLRSQPYYIAQRYADLFGIDERTFQMLTLDLERLKAEEDDFSKRQREAGVDAGKLASESTALGRSLNRLEISFEILGEAIASRFIGPLTRAIDKMTDFVGAVNKIQGSRNFQAGVAQFFTRAAAGLGLIDQKDVDELEGPDASKPAAEAGQPGKVNAAYVMKYFQAQGYSPAAAAAIAANVAKESGFDPNSYNAAGGGKGARGLFQWRGTRQHDFARMFGHPLEQSTADEQLTFAQWELTQGDYSGVGRVLRGPLADMAGQGAAMFSRDFERHGIASQDAARAALAERLLVQNTTTINVQGAGSPNATAAAVAQEQTRVNGDLVRNLRGAVQ
jgi:hypothetical protein